jgi:AraC-like DNA-binding protein
MLLPLASHPITSTTDPEEAQAVLSRQLMNLRFQRLRDRRQFRLDMNGVSLGRTAIVCNQFHAETIVDAGEVDETLLLAFGIGALTIARLDGESIDTTKRWAVCTSSRKLVIERSADSGVVFIRAGREAIEDRFREILDRRPARPIVFDRSVDGASGVGAQAHRLLTFAIDESQRNDSIRQHPLLRANLDDMLLDVLLMLPNNFSGELREGRRPAAAPGLVRRAEEFLEAHSREPVTISDVVDVCGCSRRALFTAFEKYRSYTPMQFLAQSRLRSAHMALRSPTAEDTVTSIAVACGFSHLGRFSSIYLQRYGEPPSETLRKAING